MVMSYNVYAMDVSLPDNPYATLYKRAVGIEVIDLYSRADDLYQKYIAAKAREQSLANRMLSAVAIGAGGVGAMMLASGLAEQNADAAAEQDMSAYLATFRCDFGQGRNIKGGEKQIELPGANGLLQLNQEYKTLAADLKVRKEALGLAPGIESEHITDTATTGLYDNTSIGKTDGAFTSLARALSDEAGDDAAQWAAQKAAAKKKTTTGGIVGGVGIVGGGIGNIIINGRQDNQDE